MGHAHCKCCADAPDSYIYSWNGSWRKSAKPKYQVLVTLAVVGVVRSLMSLLNSKLSFEASKQVKARLRTMVYEKMMRLGSSYKEYFQTSEVVQITTEGVEQLEIYFGKYMPQFFYSMLAPVTLFVIVGTMSLKVAVVLLICVPLIPLSIVAVQKFAKKDACKILGNIHGDGRFLFGVPSGTYDIENLSGR